MPRKIWLWLIVLLFTFGAWGAVTFGQTASSDDPIGQVIQTDTAPIPSPVARLELTAGQKKRIATLEKDPIWKNAQVSIRVAKLPGGEILYDRTPDQACIPASTNKLVTGAAAFALLGPNFRFKTRVKADARPDRQGVIHGNLYVIGGGDPNLTLEQVWKLVHGIKIAGVKRITGDLVGDDSAHDQVRFYPEWGQQTYRAYHAPLGALSVNFNTLAFFVRPGGKAGDPAFVTVEPKPEALQVVGSIQTVEEPINRTYMGYKNMRVNVSGKIGLGAMPDPSYHSIRDPLPFALGALREALLAAGIELDGTCRAGVAPKQAIFLHEHQSEELALIVRRLFRFSNNFTAEQILRTVGAEVTREQGSRAGGAEAVTAWLREQDLYQPGVVVFDGSGLARENRQTATGLTGILTWMYRRPDLFPDYLAAQAVAGVDGTLRYRFKSTALVGRVRAKTGLLNGVISLAGYCYDARNTPYAFAALVNNFDPVAGVRGPQRLTERLLDVLME